MATDKHPAAQDRWPDGSADECPKCGFLHAYDRSCEDRRSSAASPFPAGAANPPTTDPFAPCGICGHDPKLVVLDPEVWTKIVWAAKDSEDWQLRTLIEQAVMGQYDGSIWNG